MSALKIPERTEIKHEDRWDLSPLFSSDDEWSKFFTEIENGINEYEAFKGKLGASFEIFKKALDFHMDISRKVDKVFTYAHLRHDEEKSAPNYAGFFQKAMNVATRAAQAGSFMEPEIQEIPDEDINNWMTDPSIKNYSFHIEKIIRWKPHTLDAKTEELLAMSGEMASSAREIFGQLDAVDMKFGTIKDGQGRERELSHGNFVTFMQDPDREIRKKAFLQYYDAYINHKHTIAASLSGSVKKDWFYARVRKHESCLKSALFSNNIPETVYDNLLDAVKKGVPALVKYLDIRRKALGLENLHMYDLYIPLVPEVEFNMPYDEAVKTCIQALAPLGEEYTSVLEKGLTKGWVDRYENKGKQTGAYSSGCFDSPPYILMNYEPGNINSLYTLIHEAGHSMHTWLANKTQPYSNHGYSIFVAEVASTFNETLLSAYLLEKYKDNRNMTAYILCREIDNIRSTMYRQTKFAEFEKAIHSKIEANEPLTLDVITKTYKNLLEIYFGGKLEIDDALCLECLRIPHFYSAFYVYQYATGVSAAISLAKKLMTEGEEQRKRYLGFLSLGGSVYPIDALKTAGVDMSEEKAVRTALEYFEELVERLRETLAD
ncbi:oligoendopeptidase F [Desulforegula conservatrix]|uniref:oligoendopeptidase F n=1 Tax=Desulforegula conservatrix TaxID=153026 RepID=UPI00042A00A4|nr:oligoendopeptidase F [Desulforegula conservatrix]